MVWWLCKICQANMWLGTLLLDRSDDIYRMKGLLSVEGMEERFVFQVIILSYDAALYNFLNNLHS